MILDLNPKHAALTGNEVRAFEAYGLGIVIFVLVCSLIWALFDDETGGAK